MWTDLARRGCLLSSISLSFFSSIAPNYSISRRAHANHKHSPKEIQLTFSHRLQFRLCCQHVCKNQYNNNLLFDMKSDTVTLCEYQLVGCKFKPHSLPPICFYLNSAVKKRKGIFTKFVTFRG